MHHEHHPLSRSDYKSQQHSTEELTCHRYQAYRTHNRAALTSCKVLGWPPLQEEVSRDRRLAQGAYVGMIKGSYDFTKSVIVHPQVARSAPMLTCNRKKLKCDTLKKEMIEMPSSSNPVSQILGFLPERFQDESKHDISTTSLIRKYSYTAMPLSAPTSRCKISPHATQLPSTLINTKR
jgi:hypothetical protein